MAFFAPRKLTHEYELWTDNYSPQNLAEIKGNSRIVKSLDIYIKTGNLPNLIITGAHGTGKRQMCRLLIQAYFNNDNDAIEAGTFVIDGSITRGKGVVTANATSAVEPCTSNILDFVKRKITLPVGCKRLVIIHNFDMTKEAQDALRRIIELYAKNTRFIVTCDAITNIIEALQSRFTILKTVPLQDSEIAEAVAIVLEKHNEAKSTNIILTENIMGLLCAKAKGDLRMAINYLQSFAHAETHDEETFYRIFNIIPERYILSILNPGVPAAEKYILLDTLFKNGYSVTDIIETLTAVIPTSSLSDHDKIECLRKLAKTAAIRCEKYPADIYIYGFLAAVGLGSC